MSGTTKNKYISDIRVALFCWGFLDVVVSSVYRVVANVNDIIKHSSVRIFIFKIFSYTLNKTARCYAQCFPQKNNKNNIWHYWPIVILLVITNLIFDFSYNFLYVFRALNGRLLWLSQRMVTTVAAFYMLFSSLDSFYSNSISWYGILNGGINDAMIRPFLKVFFLCVSILEAMICSLYFLVTTQMSLVIGGPICFLLYFLPPFLQKFVDASVRTNCTGKSKQENYNHPFYRFLGIYVVFATVIGLFFQISSFIANIASGLPWLSTPMVFNIALIFVVFYIVNTVITAGYTWGQFIYGVDFSKPLKEEPRKSGEFNNNVEEKPPDSNLNDQDLNEFALPLSDKEDVGHGP